MHPVRASRQAFPPDEDNTRPGCLPSARPASERSSAPDSVDPRVTWRPRPPLESTTYSVVSGPRERSSVPPASSRRAELLTDALPHASGEEVLSVTSGREIDRMYTSLATLTYYELLGVPPDAEPPAIQASYEALVSMLHPNRFVRISMGSARRKVEIILECVNEAYENLVDPTRRTTYDARLASDTARTTTGGR